MRFSQVKFMALRAKRGLTMARLAELVGVATQTVGQWEGSAQRKCLPRKKYWVPIAKALQCQIADFCEADAAPALPSANDEMLGYIVSRWPLLDFETRLGMVNLVKEKSVNGVNL